MNIKRFKTVIVNIIDKIKDINLLFYIVIQWILSKCFWGFFFWFILKITHNALWLMRVLRLKQLSSTMNAFHWMGLLINMSILGKEKESFSKQNAFLLEISFLITLRHFNLTKFNLFQHRDESFPLPWKVVFQYCSLTPEVPTFVE